MFPRGEHDVHDDDHYLRGERSCGIPRQMKDGARAGFRDARREEALPTAW
jgi:hypothetical protein